MKIVEGLPSGSVERIVEMRLSKPFQRNVVEGKFFEPAYSALAMLDVIDKVAPADTGKVIAYDGNEVPA